MLSENGSPFGWRRTGGFWALCRADYVSANGGIRWRKQWVNVSSALVGQHVGLEVVDDGLLDVYFGVMKLGRLHERHMRIEDHMGRFRRCA